MATFCTVYTVLDAGAEVPVTFENTRYGLAIGMKRHGEIS
jgi:hypothetical protein